MKAKSPVEIIQEKLGGKPVPDGINLEEIEMYPMSWEAACRLSTIFPDTMPTFWMNASFAYELEKTKK